MTDNPLEIGRMVIVQPEPPAALADAKLDVGVLAWHGPWPRLTVIAKTALSYKCASDAPPLARGMAEVARFAEEPPALSLEELSPFPEADRRELYYPSDFVPRKGAVDMLVVGHAHAAMPSSRIDGQIALGNWSRAFAVETDQPTRAIPLVARHLRPALDSSREPMGPQASAPFDAAREHEPEDDFGRYNSAAPRHRVERLAPDAQLRLVGLSAASDERIVQLPGLVARARVESAWQEACPLDLVCDTLWVDTDFELIVLVWRGDCALLGEPSGVARVVVALERQGEERDWDERLRYCQRGRVHYAVRADDLAPGAPPIPRKDLDLQIARYQTWGSPAPEPRLSLDRYATISAELCEWPDRRAETLERHDLDEDRWTVEERGWLEKIAAHAQNGDARLANEHSEQFMAAQDALGAPEELKRGVGDYAFLLIEIENNLDLPTVLREQGLTLPAWLRLDRRFTKARSNDGAVDAEIEQACEQQRAARAERVEPGP